MMTGKLYSVVIN